MIQTFEFGELIKLSDGLTGKFQGYQEGSNYVYVLVFFDEPDEDGYESEYRIVSIDKILKIEE